MDACEYVDCALHAKVPQDQPADHGADNQTKGSAQSAVNGKKGKHGAIMKRKFRLVRTWGQILFIIPVQAYSDMHRVRSWSWEDTWRRE